MHVVKLHPNLEAAIAHVVAAGGIVKLPIPMEGYVDAKELDEHDKHWEPVGVRVTQQNRSTYFPQRVQALRRQYGMRALDAFKDYLVFTPEPAKEGAADHA